MRSLPNVRVHLLGLVLACSSLAGCALETDEPEAETSSDLVTGHGDFAFPSPTIVREGSTYHAWVAKHSFGGEVYNVAHATRKATEKDWKLEGEALPKLGKKAVHTGGYAVWAPAVAKIGASHWVLYYTATLQGTAEKKCIWRAHATGPAGPFVDDFDGPIECRDGSLWAIDPYLVENQKGEWYLAARIDQPGGINTIQIRELGPRAQHYAAGSSWKELTHNAPKSWEQPVLENAGIVRLKPPNGPAHWFVFYSGRAWSDDSYAIGYADCGTHIEGPCVKKTVGGPWMATNAKEKVFGPGTPTFYTDETGDTLMSVQAWRRSGGKSNPKNDGQIMRTYRMTVGDGYHPKAKPVRVDL
jgi:hypothetical protein